MNTTVLENRIMEFTNVMKGIAHNLQYFRELCEKKLAEEEAHKEENDVYRKRDIAHMFIAHKGDQFAVCDDFVIPGTESGSGTIKQGEHLTVEKVDCLSGDYDPVVTIFRNDCGISFDLTRDKLRRLIENDLIKVTIVLNRNPCSKKEA